MKVQSIGMRGSQEALEKSKLAQVSVGYHRYRQGDNCSKKSPHTTAVDSTVVL